MKKLFLFLFLTTSFFSYADPDEIVLNPSGPQKDRSDFPPQVFIDTDTGVITVDGPGYASYYYVDIISQSTLSVVLYDTVDGGFKVEEGATFAVYPACF